VAVVSSRDDNIAAFEKVMAAVNAGDGEAARPFLDESVQYEAPWYSLHVKGSDDLVRMFGALGERFASIDYRVDAIHPALDPDLLVVEAHGDHAVRDSDRRYQNQYVLFVYFEGGRIVRWIEYSNPEIYKAAVGS
jgi:ketosteroid isomerase-like protein